MFGRNGLLDPIEFEANLDYDSKINFREYIELLVEYEFIFYCTKEEAKRFPPLSMEWDFPSHASNCIIDISKDSTHEYERILNIELNEVNCRYLQLRHFNDSSIEFWQNILNIANINEIKAIDIILKDTPSAFTHESFAKWVIENKKIRYATLHSSIQNKAIQEPDYGFSAVLSVCEKICTTNHCGVIHPGYFSMNIETFTESQLHNTCLNRKIKP